MEERADPGVIKMIILFLRSQYNHRLSQKILFWPVDYNLAAHCSALAFSPENPSPGPSSGAWRGIRV